MASPAAGMGLTATQQKAVNAAVTKATAGVGGGESNAQIQSSFAAYLTNPGNNVPGAAVAPSGLDFTTGAGSNPDFLGGATASTQMIDAAFNTVSNNGHGSGFYEQGSPQVFASSWIAQLDRLFNPVSPAAAPAAAPPAAAPPVANVITAPAITQAVPGLLTAASNPTAAPIGAGTTAMPAPNPNPAVTGDVNTTTATTATTGQNLASGAPGTVLGDLLSALTNGGGSSNGSGSVSIPPSAILPTDTTFPSTTGSSGGIGSTSSATPSTASASSPSMSNMIVIGVIASLIAAAIWYFAIHHGTLKGLEKEAHL
jgi:hypothetical protein